MRLKKLFCALIVTVILLTVSACSAKENQTNALFYEKDKFTTVGQDTGGNRYIPITFEELENRARFLRDGTPNPYGLIAQCSVAGESINRIIEPSEEERDPAKIYGINHVLTPVKIDKLIFAGEYVDVRESETYLLKEPFFYIDESTKPYFDVYGKNTIYAEEYTPIQRGYKYIIYVYCKDNEIYNYDGNPVLSTIGLQEAVYCLSDERIAKDLTTYDDSNYWELWKHVVEMYK